MNRHQPVAGIAGCEEMNCTAAWLDPTLAGFDPTVEMPDSTSQGSEDLSGSADLLAYLPEKPVQVVAKGRTIYSPVRPADCIYGVSMGRVKIATEADYGGRSIMAIVRQGGIFGVSCLIANSASRETASAIDHVTIMSWTREEVQQQMTRNPRFAIAFSQHLIHKTIESNEQLKIMAMRKTAERVKLALLELAIEMGTPMTDGTTRIASLTHETLAEYVGTTREIVTNQLNRLRRLGMVQYSRGHMDICAQSIQATLRTVVGHPS